MIYSFQSAISAAWGVIAIPGEETLQGLSLLDWSEMTLNAEQMKKVHEMMVELLEAEKTQKSCSTA